MDWSKYPLHKLVYLVAGIIPGFVALLVFNMVHPGLFLWFFRLSFLGYRTQLSLLLIACLVIGHSMTTFTRALIGGFYGGYASFANKRPYKADAPSYEAAPWQDPRWRTVLTRHLGDSAPRDTRPIAPDIFEARRKMIELLPQGEQPRALYELNSEKLNTDLEDMRWERWYAHYHEIVLRPDDRDLFFHVGWGLRINLEAAALYILVSAFAVPNLRDWKWLALAFAWVLILASEEYKSVADYKNNWSTLSAQIKYLSDTQPTQQKSLF